MIEVFLRDADGKAVFPLALKMRSVPAKGDRITWWDSGTPEQGGLGMTAKVDHVVHSLTQTIGDHHIFVVLKEIQTLDANGRALPSSGSSDSDAVGQSDDTISD